MPTAVPTTRAMTHATSPNATVRPRPVKIQSRYVWPVPVGLRKIPQFQ
jgi:hypothetical protein